MEIDPKHSYKYIKNRSFRKAILNYREELYKARGTNRNIPIVLLNRYAKKYSNILKRDEDFSDFFTICIKNYLDFLLLKPRVDLLALEIKTDKKSDNINPVLTPIVLSTKTMREVTQNHLGVKESA